MSFEIKVGFENSLKHKLENVLPVNLLNEVMETVVNTLSSYDMTQKAEINSDSDDLLSVYINALQVGGRSKKTIARYKYVISKLLDSVTVPTREITVYHLRNYLSKLKETGVEDSTLEGLRQVFCAYFNWLQREGMIQKSPALNLTPIKSKKKIRQAFTDVEIECLKNGCITLRDRAIVTFLLATGCRISEMTQLNIDDVDLKNLECTVLGKGNKERTVFLDPVAAMTLAQYLDERTDDKEALFVEYRSPHRRFEPGGVRVMLNRLSRDTGIENVHPHKFRRTRATNLINHGMAVQEVAAILGHEKLDTTMRYVVMDKRSIKNSYQKYA